MRFNKFTLIVLIVCFAQLIQCDASDNSIVQGEDFWIIPYCFMLPFAPLIAIADGYDKIKTRFNTKRSKRSVLKKTLRTAYLASLCLSSPIVAPSIMVASEIRDQIEKVKKMNKKYFRIRKRSTV